MCVKTLNKSPVVVVVLGGGGWCMHCLHHRRRFHLRSDGNVWDELAVTMNVRGMRAILYAACLCVLCVCSVSAEGRKSQDDPPNKLYPADPTTLFRGAGQRCGDQKNGGEDCWPFHRYHKDIIQKNPQWDSCCRPCLDKFSDEVSLLEISPRAKRQVMKRFEIFHNHFHKTHFAIDNAVEKERLYISAQRKKSKAAKGPLSFLQGSEKKGGSKKGGAKPSKGQQKSAQVAKSGNKGGAQPSKGQQKSAQAAKNGRKGGAAKAGASGGKGEAPGGPPASSPPKKLSDLPAPTAAMGTYVTGQALLNRMKCCDICPEQFMPPADYDDSSTIDNIGFVEVEETKAARIANSEKNKPEASVPFPTESTGRSSDLGWAFHQLRNAQPYTKRIAEYPRPGEGINAVNTEPLMPMPNEGQCCNVCPLEKPGTEPLSTSFKADLNAPVEATSAGSPTSEFLEMGNSLPRPRIMGSGTVCCNTCPSIEYLVHGQMEPLGGVFGLGKLGGASAKALEEPLNTNVDTPATA